MKIVWQPPRQGKTIILKLAKFIAESSSIGGNQALIIAYSLYENKLINCENVLKKNKNNII